MQQSHAITIQKYDELRSDARDIAHAEVPPCLRKATTLKGIDNRALIASNLWDEDGTRKVDWNWHFATRYCYRHPKAFDLAIWVGNTLCCLALGRPSYTGTFMRLDFLEKTPINCPFSNEMVPITLLAYEMYAKLIGAQAFRIIDPINDKVLRSYLQRGGFTHRKGSKGNPHYLERTL